MKPILPPFASPIYKITRDGWALLCGHCGSAFSSRIRGDVGVLPPLRCLFCGKFSRAKPGDTLEVLARSCPRCATPTEERHPCSSVMEEPGIVHCPSCGMSCRKETAPFACVEEFEVGEEAMDYEGLLVRHGRLVLWLLFGVIAVWVGILYLIYRLA